MAEELHDLVAPYALDVLEPGERELFERHLEECPDCRAQLAEFQATASALAYAESIEPPPALRERILEAARAENGAKVLQFPKRRWLFPATAVTAAAAAVVAIGVGLWAASLSGELDRREASVEAIELLGQDAQVVRLSNAEGGLLVTSAGEAALVVCDLPAAPSDKTYEAWVIQGETPRPAGLFRGGSGCSPVLLDRKVPAGSQVAVTLEQRGGATQPTGPLLVRSEGV